ncbi:MAG TPA: helix-turn-helix domain-containing protein [Acidimicrobiia bacterium]|nr:helix-turn-helix domain-containing protein [Acidimicrobiia bacterium]
MPERSFGRTVRYRRTKLGLSQAKLGELVGRSTATIRSWERDKSRPNDPKVLGALAAILGIDERHLFGKADVEQPTFEETSPTVEQALATLSPGHEEPVAAGSVSSQYEDLIEPMDRNPADPNVRHLVGVAAGPAFVAPPDPYVQGPLTPNLTDVSYMEDPSQRQIYRVRTLATVVALVALVVAFLWAFEEGLGALGEWWDGFFGNLRL